jgi:hypothetical protein
MHCSLTEKGGNAGIAIHCKLCSFYLMLGQHAIRFYRELEEINTAQMQLFSTIGSFKTAVIFSDPAVEIQSLAKADAAPSKRVTEIDVYIKQFKELSKLTFQDIMPLKANTNPGTECSGTEI